MRLPTRILALSFRVLALAFLLLCLAAGIHDAFRSFPAGTVRLSSLGELWFALSPETLNLAQAVVQRHVSPALWDPVIQTLLASPAVVSLLVPSVVFGLVARAINRPRYRGRRPHDAPEDGDGP